MRLRNIVDSIDYIELVNCERLSAEVEGISYSSKKTKEHDLFICLTGEHVDGHVSYPLWKLSSCIGRHCREHLLQRTC